MVKQVATASADLYDIDETAWLETAAELIRQRRLDSVELDTLAEYLTDMAKRDRREVFSRLVVLLSHLLEWDALPDRRSGSWKGSILEQQRELRLLTESGTLHRHALEVLGDAFAEARKQAAAETGLPKGSFPAEIPWELDNALADQDEESSSV